MRKGKISIYAADNEASGAFNTNLNTNIAQDNTDESGAGSMWKQNLPKVLENFFLSEYVWEKSYTTLLAQLQTAFNDEGQFINFMNGCMTEIQNDVESTLEANARMLVTDRIAGTYLAGPATSKVNLTALVNKKLGTSYTTAELKTSHRKELLEVLTAYIKIYSDRMEERTTNYHDPKTINVGGTSYSILRHTPKSKQKLMLFSEILTEAKSIVMPEIFNPEYLSIDNYEGVTYWQSSTDRMAIKCKPSLPDGAESRDVELDNVVGILFDTDALETNNYFTGAYNTPINAKHLYYNTFYHYKYGAINDYTENAIIFYMEDPAA